MWKIDSPLLETLRARIPEMAQGKIGMPGFVHGTWTVDGYLMQVYADEESARKYHADMLSQGAVERPGQRCVVWDVAEVGAESACRFRTDEDTVRGPKVVDVICAVLTKHRSSRWGA